MSGRTYERIWDRCYNEIVKGETKHLIVLIGVPIAYPRLVRKHPSVWRLVIHTNLALLGLARKRPHQPGHGSSQSTREGWYVWRIPE